MPSIFIAGCLSFYPSIAVVNSQVQCNHAVTSGSILLCKDWLRGGCRIHHTMPSIFIAGCLSFYPSVAVVDGQIKCIHIRAYRTIGGILKCVRSTGSIVLSMPTVGIASHGMIGNVGRDIHCQMQCVRARASVVIDIVKDIFSTLGKLVTLPHVSFTHMLIKDLVGAMPQGEVQVYHTVAAYSIPGHIRRCVGTFRIGHPMPIEHVAVCSRHHSRA